MTGIVQHPAGVIPNPGSDTAVAAGCRCPVMDNRRGLSSPRPPDGWWVTGDCPIHGQPVDAS